MNKKTETPKFKIGHGAYSGRNALSFSLGKTAATEELRKRGMTRAVARLAINKVMSSSGGYAVLSDGKHLSFVCELEHLRGEREIAYSQCFNK